MTNSQPGFLQRTEALVGKKVLEVLRNSTVAIAGMGGVGGAIAPVLARMGVGSLKIADPGAFDLPDLNRQYAADQTTLGRNKASAYVDTLSRINPDITLETYEQGVTDENLTDFIRGADLVVDALDVQVPALLRLAFHAEVRAQNKFALFPPIIGFGTLVATSDPSGMTMEPVMALLAAAAGQGQLPHGLSPVIHPDILAIMEKNMAAGCIPSIAIAPNLVSALVATEILLLLCRDELPVHREPTILPQMTVVDLFTMKSQIIHFEQLIQSAK